MAHKERAFIVGLQDPKEATCFKDVAEFDVRAEAIRRADALSAKEGRPCSVFERWEGIIYRTDRKEEAKARPEPFKSKRKRKPS